ncbi:MAG: hypothetical protein HY738_03305 [Bacteroidia bacterium]|nr:hypothetical protein [Bacteroidia bacterium]
MKHSYKPDSVYQTCQRLHNKLMKRNFVTVHGVNKYIIHADLIDYQIFNKFN